MNPADILYHITVFGRPTDTLETSGGRRTYAQWLASERARIRRKGNWSYAQGAAPVAIYTNPATQEISLVHLRVRGSR